MALKIWTYGMITSVEEVKAKQPGKKDRLKVKIAFNSKDRNSYQEPTFWLNGVAWDETAQIIKESFDNGKKFMKMFVGIYSDSYTDKATDQVKHTVNATIFKAHPFEKDLEKDYEDFSEKNSEKAQEENNQIGDYDKSQTLGELIESAKA